MLNSGNCSIDAYRLLWADTVTSVGELVSLVQAVNASGLNLDLG